ncbi:hypothetical protein JTB14_025568 [Gonioctena quinquepunctata]|nr:hypothetical protein JTB14_025568 [Gonioctena quinquepunctata]
MEDINFVGITLQEALYIAYASDSDTEVAEVFIEPPESHVLTDEDSAAEDEEGLADNLSSRQLTDGVEIRFTNSRRVRGIADDLNSDSHNEISAGTSCNGYLMEENIGNMSTSNTKKTNKTELKLHKVPAYPKYCDDADLLFTVHYFPKDNHDMYKYMTHCELFELFLLIVIAVHFPADNKLCTFSKLSRSTGLCERVESFYSYFVSE